MCIICLFVVNCEADGGLMCLVYCFYRAITMGSRNNCWHCFWIRIIA